MATRTTSAGTICDVRPVGGERDAAPGAAGAGSARRRNVKVTTYKSGNVPGVSYRGGYAHSPPDDADELRATGIQQPVTPAQAAGPAPGGTRVMPVGAAGGRGSGGPPEAPPYDDRPPRREPKPPKRRRSFGFRLFRGLLFLILIIVIALGALGWFVWSKIDKVDAIPDDPGSARSEGRVYLLVGSDSREDLTEEEQSELGTGNVSGKRTDTIMLLHQPTDGRPALISIPRDSIVDIPGHDPGRINAAYAYGGAPLLVETIQNNTGVAIDDYVEIGFGGFAGIVDALGGVEMCLDEAIQDDKAHLDLPAGCQTLDGTDALGFARARYFDPTADIGRVERQRELIGAIADKALTPGTLLNPMKLVQTGTSSSEALVIDEDTGPFDMLGFMRGIGAVSGDGGDTLTVPLGNVGNTVDWHPELAPQLWTALQDGTSVPDAVLDAQN